MWPFKKKVNQQKQSEKVTKRVVYREEEIDIGRTRVKIDLQDNREFYTFVYGEFGQYVDHGMGDYNPHAGKWECNKNPNLGPPSVTPSLHKAQEYVQNLHDRDSSTFLDNPKGHSRIIIGKPRSAEIGSTESYKEKFNVAYIEDIKDEG